MNDYLNAWNEIERLQREPRWKQWARQSGQWDGRPHNPKAELNAAEQQLIQLVKRNYANFAAFIGNARISLRTRTEIYACVCVRGGHNLNRRELYALLVKLELPSGTTLHTSIQMEARRLGLTPTEDDNAHFE